MLRLFDACTFANNSIQMTISQEGDLEIEDLYLVIS